MSMEVFGKESMSIKTKKMKMNSPTYIYLLLPTF